MASFVASFIVVGKSYPDKLEHGWEGEKETLGLDKMTHLLDNFKPRQDFIFCITRVAVNSQILVN